MPQKIFSKKLLAYDHKRATFKRKEEDVKNKETISRPKTKTLRIKPSQNNNERTIKTGFDSIITIIAISPSQQKQDHQIPEYPTAHLYIQYVTFFLL